MKTDDIRRAYLEFFRSKAHEIVPSDSLVPKDDPTLLFTGAGMNQFKEKFLGRNITYRRAASCQKCLRTGDLENVGRTSGHHTFFEMLGNFSFGDYFKKEAIEWAWEFLADRLQLKAERLWVSVYKDDDEAYNIWRDIIKLPGTRIIRLGEKENFWPSQAPTKGPNGPCGPCSEIFYDWGKDAGCGKPDCSPDCDCGRWSEVWNLVFTQYDRQPDGSLKPLPSKNIDTGMGLERIAAVMQGARTNFEIDIFKPITAEIEKSLNRKPKTENRKPKINAIADHIRAVTFTIADGVMPSNEERGYVVRKLIRRSMAYANDLGVKETILYKLVSAVVEAMNEPYPELKTRRDDIAQIVKQEEENFLSIVDTELPRVGEAFKAVAESGDTGRLADLAFNFYDTYGMPYEMLEEIAERFRLKIDKTAFEALLDRQRAKSRSKTKIRSEIFSETFAKKVESMGFVTQFLGYENSHGQAKVLAVLEGGEVILDKTPFYGESGGQVGDWGEIETASGNMKVEDAKRIGDTIVHIGTLERGKILKGEAAKVSIDEKARGRVMRNHTATHLLQAALRKVLGGHVHQTGSLVDKDHLRFDFTHMKKMSERELLRAEEIVNENIKNAIPVKKDIKDLESAKAEGAIALFGEKYDKTVRVVTVGDVSKELCGGTHVDNTGQIGYFKITGESSVASGVRRIEAMTGDEARKWQEEQLKAQSSKLKAEGEKKAEKMRLKKRLEEESVRVDDFIKRARRTGVFSFVGEIIEDADVNILRMLSDRIRSKLPSCVTVLATKGDEKASFIVSVTDDIVKTGKIKANDVAKELSAYLGGSGGGKPDFAQGGGRSPSKLKEAIDKVFEIVKERTK